MEVASEPNAPGKGAAHCQHSQDFPKRQISKKKKKISKEPEGWSDSDQGSFSPRIPSPAAARSAPRRGQAQTKLLLSTFAYFQPRSPLDLLSGNPPWLRQTSLTQRWRTPALHQQTSQSWVSSFTDSHSKDDDGRSHLFLCWLIPFASRESPGWENKSEFIISRTMLMLTPTPRVSSS